MELVSLRESALILGVTLAYLKERVNRLGWVPVAKKGSGNLYLKRAVSEFHLANRLSNNRLDIYWLPWGLAEVRRVVERADLSHSPKPPKYRVKVPGVKMPVNYYYPPEVKAYASTQGFEFNFLNGFSGEAREAWNEQICIWERDG
jgi:hypothetical protein